MTPRRSFEIVGPPGSGKTTVVRRLAERHPEFRPQMPPDWRKPGRWPFFVRTGIVLAPTFAALTFGPGGRRLRPEEYFGLLCLRGWHRLLRRRGLAQGAAVLDQGPVFMLAELAFFRGEQIVRMSRRPGWARTLDRWRPLIGGIVWLDAPDPVLLRRINAREKGHLIKGAPDVAATDFLARSRVSLEQAVSMLRAGRRSPAVMTFETGDGPVDEVVEKLARALRSDDAWDDLEGGEAQ